MSNWFYTFEAGPRSRPFLYYPPYVVPCPVVIDRRTLRIRGVASTGYFRNNLLIMFVNFILGNIAN
jgi:hypothetical protein